ncbi:fungal-specific transcription factor domain-containing protein [Lentinula aciculospora]|uniref:Fungal-specific transcription factor domain-containing protein n=1 Tax=Lentinula aciculospora TaxID=153920 RepID=A0A9W8ZSY8_9AGAR|nr:fungal-specific transcription factor domain-containing protein [Lentinula aciculospora]
MNEKVKQPHKRILNACDHCRKRRGDSATAPGNVCSECLRWKTDCTHNMPNKVHLGFVRTLVVDLALHVRSLETQLKQAHNSMRTSSSSSPSFRDVSEADTADSDSDALACQLDEILTIDDKRHYGSSSTFQFVRNALHMKGELSGGGAQPSIKVSKLKRPELWTVPKWQFYYTVKHPPYTFPEDDLMHNLIDLYFTNVEPYFPMLHRPTLERSILNGLHLTDRRLGAILLMICSLASQHSDDPRTLLEGIESEYSRGWKYFRQIRLIHQFEEPPSIYEFQLYPLASLYLHTTNLSGAAFFLITLGLRSAHQTGIHERHFVVLDNPVETELWRRAFWCLIVFDIYGSTTLGRPRATTPENVDADYPQDLNDESREKDMRTFPQSATILSPLAFWIHYIKLFEIIGLSNRNFYSVKPSELWSGSGISGPEWDQKFVVELDTALNKWVDSIPSHLRWDPQGQNETSLRQSSMLYATYYWAQFQVHKPFISRSTQSEAFSMFPSVTICANSARSLIGLLETLYHQQAFGPLFDSAIVLLINLWRGLRNLDALDPTKELGDVRRCINLLSMYEKR